MRQIFIGLFFAFAFLGLTVTVGAQDVEDGLGTAPTANTEGHYYPRANSTHSMRKCGVTEESLNAMGYTIRITLTEPLELIDVETCYDKNRKLSKYVNRLIGKPNQPIIMGVGSAIWVNPKDTTHAYAAGCLNGINVKKVPYNPPVYVAPNPTPSPSPQIKPCESTPSSVRKQIDGKWATVSVNEKCEYSTIYEAEVSYQDTCPTVTSAEYGSKGFWNRMPSWQELLLGPGKAVLIAAIANRSEDRGKAMAISGIASGVDTVATGFFFPDYNVLNLQTSEGPMSVQKGKKPFEIFIQKYGTLRLEWKKDNNIQLTSGRGVCFAGAVQKGFQTASDVVIFRDRTGTTKTVPIKTQTQTPVGQGGLNGGGCIPGGRNCPIVTSVPTLPSAGSPTYGNGVPVRPFVETLSGGSSLPSQNLFQGSGSQNNQSQPKNSCDADPTAVCMDVLQRDGTIKRMRVN